MNFKNVFRISLIAFSFTAMTSNAQSAPTQVKPKLHQKKSHLERIEIGKWETPSEPDLRSKLIQEKHLNIHGNKNVSVTADTTGYDETYVYNGLHANPISANYRLFSF